MTAILQLIKKHPVALALYCFAFGINLKPKDDRNPPVN